MFDLVVTLLPRTRLVGYQSRMRYKGTSNVCTRFYKKPRFSLAWEFRRSNRPTPSPIIHSVPGGRKQKMSQSFSNNTNSFNTTVNNITITPDERSNILAWLSPLEPRLRHQDIQDNRVENIGEWRLQTEEFRNWFAGSEGSESDNGVLFCYGNPGVGKTYIR